MAYTVKGRSTDSWVPDAAAKTVATLYPAGDAVSATLEWRLGNPTAVSIELPWIPTRAEVTTPRAYAYGQYLSISGTAFGFGVRAEAEIPPFSAAGTQNVSLGSWPNKVAADSSLYTLVFDEPLLIQNDEFKKRGGVPDRFIFEPLLVLPQRSGGAWGHVFGRTTCLGNAAKRVVWALDVQTMERKGVAPTDADGYYDIKGLDPSRSYVIVARDMETGQNAVVFDRVQAVPDVR